MKKSMPPPDDERKASAKQATSVEADDAFWYKRFPHKALAGFRGLNMEQRGFYATLIELVFEQRGPLADDDVENARTFGADIRKFRRVKAELLELERITVEEGALFDARAVRELVRAGLYSETQARRAKTRWRKARGEHPPRVVSINPQPRPKTDFGPTIGPTVAATVAATVARNVGGTPNEIKGPPDAEEKRREEDTNSEPKGPTDRAPPAASPPSTGGGGRIEKRATKEAPNVAHLSRENRRAGIREALEALNAVSTEAHDEPSDDDEAERHPADRLCKRSGGT